MKLHINEFGSLISTFVLEYCNLPNYAKYTPSSDPSEASYRLFIPRMELRYGHLSETDIVLFKL